MLIKRIECSNCGGEIHFDPDIQLTICSFCGSSFEIEQAKEISVADPDWIVPFKVSKDGVEKVFLSWIVKGKYTPVDILSFTSVDSLVGIYLPFYNFHGHYRAEWTASCGYDREEIYTEYEEKYSNGRTYREPVTKRRTVTDWRPGSGSTANSFSIMSPAFHNLPDKSLLFCSNTGWKNPMRFDKRYILGFALQPFINSQEDCYNSSAEGTLKRIIDNHVRQSIPGNTYRDLNWNYQVDKNATSICLPFWFIRYNYLGNIFQCIIDGQNIERIEGKRPLDKNAIRKTILFFVPGTIALVIYVVPLIVSKPTLFVKIAGGIVVFVLLLFGVIGQIIFSNKCKQLREQTRENFKLERDRIPEKFSKDNSVQLNDEAFVSSPEQKKQIQTICPHCDAKLTDIELMGGICNNCHKEYFC